MPAHASEVRRVSIGIGTVCAAEHAVAEHQVLAIGLQPNRRQQVCAVCKSEGSQVQIVRDLAGEMADGMRRSREEARVKFPAARESAGHLGSLEYKNALTPFCEVARAHEAVVTGPDNDGVIVVQLAVPTRQPPIR